MNLIKSARENIKREDEIMARLNEIRERKTASLITYYSFDIIKTKLKEANFQRG